MQLPANDIPGKLRVPSQMALDAKASSLSEATLADLGRGKNLAYTYYKGLIVSCTQEASKWEWKEVFTPLKARRKLLTEDFTYPANWIVDGINYSNKTYNFYFVVEQDNIKRELLIDTPLLPSVNTFADAINNLSSFEVTEQEVLVFKSVSSAEEVTFYVELLDVGKGTYGINGSVVLTPENIKLTSVKTAVDDIRNDAKTQTFDLGTAQMTVLEKINTATYPIEIQSQSDGYVIITGTFNGIIEEYLWIGQGGSYGRTGNKIATYEDLKLLFTSATPDPDDPIIPSNPTDQDNISKVIYVSLSQLSGTGTIEEQISGYINSLNYLKRDIDADIWVEFVDTELPTPTPDNPAPDPEVPVPAQFSIDFVRHNGLSGDTHNFNFVSPFTGVTQIRINTVKVEGHYDIDAHVLIPSQNSPIGVDIKQGVWDCSLDFIYANPIYNYSTPVIRVTVAKELLSYSYESLWTQAETDASPQFRTAHVDYLNANGVIVREPIPAKENGCHIFNASSIFETVACQPCTGLPPVVEPEPITVNYTVLIDRCTDEVFISHIGATINLSKPVTVDTVFDLAIKIVQTNQNCNVGGIIFNMSITVLAGQIVGTRSPCTSGYRYKREMKVCYAVMLGHNNTVDSITFY